MKSRVRLSSMKEGKEVGTEARSNREKPDKREIDILKIMQQCGIHPDKWKDYIKDQQK
ncbi:MAG TPA: hypothetical protein VGI33_09390 [Paenibacillus sp.]